MYLVNGTLAEYYLARVCHVHVLSSIIIIIISIIRLQVCN